jgi:hypothetical protein
MKESKQQLIELGKKEGIFVRFSNIKLDFFHAQTKK